MHAPPAGQRTTWQLFIEWNRLACEHASVLTKAHDALRSFHPGSPVCLYTWSPWRWRWTWDGARGRETVPSSRPPPQCVALENKAHFLSGVFVTVRLGDRAHRASLTVGEEAGKVQDSPSKQGGAHSGRQRFMAHLEAAVKELEQTRYIMGKQNQNQAIFMWKMLI